MLAETVTLDTGAIFTACAILGAFYTAVKFGDRLWDKRESRSSARKNYEERQQSPTPTQSSKCAMEHGNLSEMFRQFARDTHESSQRLQDSLINLNNAVSVHIQVSDVRHTQTLEAISKIKQ